MPSISRGRTTGFTLIELLVVFAIIALFTSLIFASLSAARMKARDAKRIATARSLKTALALWEDKSGAIYGINSGGRGSMLAVSATTSKSIIDVLVQDGALQRNIASDSIFGVDAYYLGVCPDGRYDVFSKLEQSISAQSSTTLSSGCDGSGALAAGYNYSTGMGSGAGASGVVAVGGGGGGGGGSPTGSVVYTAATSTMWQAPPGVTSVSVVAVGGGGGQSPNFVEPGGGGALGYKNSIAVSPGSYYLVVVGAKGMPGANGGNTIFDATTTIIAGGGKAGQDNGNRGLGGVFGGPGVFGGNGGSSGYGIFSTIYAGAGGAGGYAGSGGDGASANTNANGLAGVGGAGGGSASGNGSCAGGGVGLYGLGASGAGGVNSVGGWSLSGGGKGGSGGANGKCPFVSGAGSYGAGSGTGGFGTESAVGAGGGGLRIVWPGDTRLFPSTGVASTTGEAVY